MRAVKHDDGGAGRLVLTLMHLQVTVFNIDRQMQPFTLNGGRKRGRDVEVESVAKLIGLGGPAGFDSGGQVARVMAAKAGAAQRSQQVAQRLEAQEVQAL